jgi:ADP-ribosylglycohydrolase
MRVSPIGWLFNSLEETLQEAKRSAEVTHNHPEGIKGAQAIAMAIYLARQQVSKEEIRSQLKHSFKYDFSRSISEI